ncbi:MAG: SAM-dependent methyltransferase [Verrucomicrobiota bacterium]
MRHLEEIIRQEIAERGAMPFARFMELALYHPTDGYYERDARTIGRHGDFFTSVSVGRLFGELLAFQFGNWLQKIPTDNCCLVEAGGHDGQLAFDVLSYLRVYQPALCERIEYGIVEPSARRRSRQTAVLREFSSKVRWFESLDCLPGEGVSGIIFSNELLDALPVHRFGWDASVQRWFEWGVTIKDVSFVYLKMPIPEGSASAECFSSSWPDLPREFLEVLPDGFTTEVSPAAKAWWRRASHALKTGHLLTIDYGLNAEEFLNPERKNGTIRAYSRHHSTSDLLRNIGEQDLTAHVNFTALTQAGEEVGLRTAGLLSQEKFLTQIAEQTWQRGAPFRKWSPEDVRQFQTLTHPEHLGRSFRVLIQSR